MRGIITSVGVPLRWEGQDYRVEIITGRHEQPERIDISPENPRLLELLTRLHQGGYQPEYEHHGDYCILPLG